LSKSSDSEILQLDARRLLCPMPIIRLQNFMLDQTVGAKVEVSCSDPGSINDIPAWCRINGHFVLSIEDKGVDIKIIVQKGSD